MRIVLIGHDFDFSAGDGVSRYSYELCTRLSQIADVRTMSTGKLPRPMRALLKVNVKDADIVHLMYPNVAKVNKGGAKMVATWHDLRVFNKYLEQEQYRTRPKLIERLNIANTIIKRWTVENYAHSDAIIFNSSQTRKEFREYFSAHKLYDPGKAYALTQLGVDADFLRAKIWRGRRSDFAYVGAIHFRHKNLEGLLRVFNMIAARSKANLHIFTYSPNAAGLLRDGMKRFPNLSYRNVFLHASVPSKEISRYIPRLSAYLQLTKHEGLGMPILEALAMGTNVLTLKGAQIPQETRKYVISGTEEQIAEKALELARHSEPAPQKAIDYARSFTWERTVKETMAVYSKLLAK